MLDTYFENQCYGKTERDCFDDQLRLPINISVVTASKTKINRFANEFKVM